MATKTLPKALPSLRDRILASPRASQTVMVDEWGVEVRIRELSLAERQSLLQHVYENEKAREAYLADQALAEDERTGIAEVQPLDHNQVMLMTGIVDPLTDEGIFGLDDYEAFKAIGYVTMRRLLEIFFSLNVYQTQQSAEDLKKTSA